MRIAVLAHLKYPIAEPFSGGLEMHTHLLVRKLRAMGHEVRLFAAEGSDPALEPVIICPPTGTPTGAREIEAVALLEHEAYTRILQLLAVERFDVIHNNALHYLPLTLAHTLPAPMVTVLHTPPFPELANAVAEMVAPGPFIAVSNSVRQAWASLVPACVVPNGIDLLQFRGGLSTLPPHALWSGRIVPEKGLHLAMDAARLAGIKLRIAGPRSNNAYWQDMIAPRLQGDVTYLGHLKHDALALAMSEATVALCTPRWEEPYGLVVAEALASGTPVAGFARGALPHLVDESCGRLAPADDIVALARCIIAAAGLSRQDCRLRAEALGDATGMVRAYETIYRAQIGTPAPRVLDIAPEA
jgi:UDP-glucose:tetrahydrobiopterin glucosyltransferase